MSSIDIKNPLEKFLLQGKKAVITGAAGGIGSVITKGFMELGVDVAILDKNTKALEKLKKKCKFDFSDKILIVPVDVLDMSSINEGVKSIIEHYHRIDFLVNCHGIGQWSPAIEISIEEWDHMIDTNLKGVFLMCQAVGKYMIKQKYGKIVNIASMSGLVVNKPQSQAHYNTSKAAVIMLTKSLAVEWAKYNINVNCISPGYTLTPLVHKLLNTNPGFAKQWKTLIPKKRFASPEDIVGSVLFLVSNAADYITGHNLVVDGGYTLW
jgi:NAD(P)-dependent dehydrogenase (short-subunit alcohol dehydrogenase family)